MFDYSQGDDPESQKTTSTSTLSAQARDKESIDKLRATAEHDRLHFYANLARAHLTWKKPFLTTLDASHAPKYRWFPDGTLNASVNCLDRHLTTRGQQDALCCISDSGAVVRVTYASLFARVCNFASLLVSLGVRPGDRVIILLPTGSDAVTAMLACARIGAIHAVVFAGFSAESLRARMDDASPVVVVTCDVAYRAGKRIALYALVDAALTGGEKCVQSVVVFKRDRESSLFDPSRDAWADELLEQRRAIPQPVEVSGDTPLFLLYTSGSTGRPKGVVHGTAGYLLGASTSLAWALDVGPGDVFFCTADVGWITGHTYGVYGPLLNGATSVLFEGSPLHPSPDRYWKICADHAVTVLYTSPTAIRALMRFGAEPVRRYDLSRLRILGSVGEPINSTAWRWLAEVVGQKRCPIVDTWWQTETGSILAAPLPYETAPRPGTCRGGLPGVVLDVLDESGHSVRGTQRSGALVVTQPWPSMMQTLWGDDTRYIETYWSQFGPEVYVTGDGAFYDSEDNLVVTGRLDDVLNVSGHRLGTMELESALASHPLVLEAAVVGRPDAIKGESIYAFVVLRDLKVGVGNVADKDQWVEMLRAYVAQKVGALARPDAVQLCPELPKTRSGKIMRRLLRSLARGDILGQDTSTLENPELLHQLRAERISPSF